MVFEVDFLRHQLIHVNVRSLYDLIQLFGPLRLLHVKIFADVTNLP